MKEVASSMFTRTSDLPQALSASAFEFSPELIYFNRKAGA